MRFDSNLFAAKLRGKRNEIGMSQQELEEKSGVSQTTISKFESGLYEPKIETIDKMAPHLEVTPSEMIAWGYAN